MIEISLNNICKMYEEKYVLNDINLEIKEKEKIAIIGDNGSGKSTLLKILARVEKPTSGLINYKKDLKVGVLFQNEYDYFKNELVIDILSSAFEELNKVEKEMNELEKKLREEDSKKLDKIIKKYCYLQEEYMSKGGYEIKSKIEKIVSAFKLNDLLNREYNILSGGEKTIVRLVYLLLKDVDVLFLDEPTNHLDLDAVAWLENYLINYDKTVIVVSHDRYFLDKVSKKTILVENQKIDIYHGSYSYYLVERENRLLKEFSNYKNQQKQIEAMKKSIKRLREFAAKTGTGGEIFYRRAASIQKRLDKIIVLDKPVDKNKLDIKFEFSTRSGEKVLEIKDLTIGYEKVLLDNVSLSVYYQDRLCIIGKNGSGKSSLIKEILTNVNIKLGSNIRIGYIPQENVFDNTELTVMEEVRRVFVGEEKILRSALSKFYFYSRDINRKIKNLSGGEKVRLKLFILMQQNSNLLVLDEVTNHIDISTKEMLEEALKEYKGTIIFISHDRYFINSLATKIVAIENKKLKTYIGNYDDYYRMANLTK